MLKVQNKDGKWVNPKGHNDEFQAKTDPVKKVKLKDGVQVKDGKK